MKVKEYPEIMTLDEVSEFFRVEKRILKKYGLKKLGGVCLGPRSWRFLRSEVMKHGIQEPEQKQREVPLDGAKIHSREKREEVFCFEERSASMGNGNNKRARKTRDPYNLLN